MAGITPPDEIVKAFVAPVTRHTRRVEIYEQDGVTRWAKDNVIRLKGGQVSVDYSRDERRTLDLTLDNSDGALKTQAGELWYDKIIKVFRGVRIERPKPTPKILVISSITDNSSRTGMLSGGFRDKVSPMGYFDIEERLQFDADNGDLSPYDIIVALDSSDAVTSNRVLKIMDRAVMAGKSVFALGYGVAYGFLDDQGFNCTAIQDPALPIEAYGYGPTRHPVAQGWTSFSPRVQSPYTVNKSIHISNSAAMTNLGWKFDAIEQDTPGPLRSSIYAVQQKNTGGRVVTVSLEMRNGLMAGIVDSYVTQESVDQFNLFMRAALGWLDQTTGYETWETQVGEFMIDRLQEDNFPHDIKITGRDYTKRCMLSKFERSTQFTTGQTLEKIVGDIASNAGITKKSLAATGVVVNNTFLFERGTERWVAMKQIANTYNFDLYFDSFGYLTLTPYADPSTTPPSVSLNVGPGGTLAKWSKSAGDARLYNHVLVTNESSTGDTLPMYAEARNEDPNSPTSIAEIGDRLYQYVSTFFTEQSQLQETADRFLAIHSLEEFELSFDSLMLPWLEVGEIVQFDDGLDTSDPTRFLLSSLTIPLSLGPMGGNGKRVVIVS